MTQSENIVSKISKNIFFQEFTFDKSEFNAPDGRKELADNVLWLDDLLFIIQIKERNIKEVKTEQEENRWFENTILNSAKKQIKKSISFFQTYDEIKIKNIRNHEIDVSKANLENANKIIIYMPNSSLLNTSNKSLKFYQSAEIGNIHVLNIEDYLWICKFLITPTELDEYLKFRERIYLKHKEIIQKYPEQYMLSHFLNTDDESVINEHYIDTFKNFIQDNEAFDFSGILEIFLEKINSHEKHQPTNYYPIVKEIAKLKRYELLEFKKRFEQMINHVKSNEFSLPYRFTIARTGCGFVLIPLASDFVASWKNGLLNFTEIYKYKRGLSKCLGVLAYKRDQYFDINWAFVKYDWSFNEVLEDAVNRESEYYGEGEEKKVERYKFKQ